MILLIMMSEKCLVRDLILEDNYEDNSLYKASECDLCNKYVCKECYIKSYWLDIEKNFECPKCGYFLCCKCLKNKKICC